MFTFSRVSTQQEADRLVSYALEPGLFATPLTPGEKHVITHDPYDSLTRETSAYWFLNDQQGVMRAIIGIREHVNHTGIFEITCIAVSPAQRQKGIGSAMLNTALQYIRQIGGRGMLVDTSDHAAYQPMQKLLTRNGFTKIGHIPDFYFPGEGTLFYYKLLSSEEPS